MVLNDLAVLRTSRLRVTGQIFIRLDELVKKLAVRHILKILATPPHGHADRLITAFDMELGIAVRPHLHSMFDDDTFKCLHVGTIPADPDIDWCPRDKKVLAADVESLIG